MIRFDHSSLDPRELLPSPEADAFLKHLEHLANRSHLTLVQIASTLVFAAAQTITAIDSDDERNLVAYALSEALRNFARNGPQMPTAH